MVGCVRRADTRRRTGHGQTGHGQTGHGQTGHGQTGHAGQTGQPSGQAGQPARHAAQLTGRAGQTGQTGQPSGHTGQSSGQAGQSSGQAGQSSGQAGQSSVESKQKCGQKSTQIYGQFWRRGRFLIVFLLALMSVRSSRCGGGGGGAPLGAALVCARAPGLTERQRAMCRAAPAAMAAVADGLRMAYAECAAQMRGRRWNCSGVSDPRHFSHVIPMATKEAAYTYAITSAGVTHALSAACARGDLPSCGCNHRRRSAGAWEWGGGAGGAGGGGGGGARCGEAALGARFARRFLDARELEHDARALMNLHNNRLGRKTVKALVSLECKCHGVSGSCGVRTCWRALPPFRRVAAALAHAFRNAVQVTAAERGTTLDGRVNLQLVVAKKGRGGGGRSARKSELVFLAASPAYCEPEPAAAALGTHSRLCNHTSTGEDGCAQLCCGRGYSTVRATSRVQCRCSFRWCCTVRCDSCLRTTELHVCN